MFHKLVYSCAVFVVLSAFSDGAKAACSVPNTLTNGTTADATAVYGNFISLAGCAAPLASPSFTGTVSMSGPLSVNAGTTSSYVSIQGGTQESFLNLLNSALASGNRVWRLGIRSTTGTGGSFVVDQLNDAGTSITGTPLAINSTGNISLGGGHIFGQASGGALLFLGTGTTDSVVLDGGINGFYPNVDNAWSNGYSTRRWTTVFATNGTIQTSDARLKKDIANLKAADGLPAVLKLRPVTFHWKEPSADRTIHYGFVAQEVQTILPNVVDIGNDSHHMLGMNYSSFIPSIVKAVQELNQKVERNRNAERRDASIASMKLRLSNQQLQLSELGKKYEAELLELGLLRGELKRLQRKLIIQTAQR